MHSLIHGFEETALLLLKKGADPHIRDIEGNSAKDFAVRNTFSEFGVQLNQYLDNNSVRDIWKRRLESKEAFQDTNVAIKNMCVRSNSNNVSNSNGSFINNKNNKLDNGSHQFKNILVKKKSVIPVTTFNDDKDFGRQLPLCLQDIDWNTSDSVSTI